MHDVACEFARAVVRSKDAQKQLARTSLKHLKCYYDQNIYFSFSFRCQLKACLFNTSLTKLS